MNDEIASMYGYIISSSRRLQLVIALGEGYLTPTQIATKINVRPNHISAILKDLELHKIVICINPEMRKGRLYRLTDYGRKILPILEKHT